MDIQTSRSILVPISESHTMEIFKNLNEQIITYMEPPVAKTINETHETVIRFIRQQKNNTDYVFAITLKISGEFIGIHNLKNEVPELGIWIKINSNGYHYGR